MSRTIALLLVAAAAFAQAPTPTVEQELARAKKTLQDWPNLARYRNANTEVKPPEPGENRVVFVGASIVDNWGRKYGKFFPAPVLNRGIGGQTTPQVLLRFRFDAIALKPAVVVIMPPSNDLAGNTGPITLEESEGNLASMAELARANGIRVVMASLTPVCDCFRPMTDRRPPEKIRALNEWIRAYAEKNGHTWLDYYSAMIDDQGLMRKELTFDGLHPNDAGYAIMEPLAAKAIAEALARKQKRLP